MNTERALTKAPDKRRQWLRVRLHVPPRDANQTRSLLSVARSLNESKSRQWTTTAQSAFSFKIEPISDSMLNRSFVSLLIFPTGKLTITNASNAGHRCTANNNQRPAARRVFCILSNVMRHRSKLPFLVKSRSSMEHSFRTGATVPSSGIYQVVHKEHRLPEEVILIGGAQFPRCSKCDGLVMFSLGLPVQALNGIL